MTQGVIHFVSGLPRTGSTLLMNLLGQNPMHAVTPTSGVVHLVRAALDGAADCQEFKSQDMTQVQPRIDRAISGIVSGYFADEFKAGKTVFDKSRGWLEVIEPMERALGRRMRIIAMVRDVRAIVASFEKLYQQRDPAFRREGEPPDAMRDVYTRATTTLSKDQVTGRSIERLMISLRDHPDRLLIVPYDVLTRDPVGTLGRIHDWLGLAPFRYNPDRVEQITHEDDSFFGVDLHTIRPKVEPAPSEPWKDVLPADLCERIVRDYAVINQLAAGPVVTGEKRSRAPLS